MIHVGICDDMTTDRAALKKTLTKIPGCFYGENLIITEYSSGEAILFEVENGRGDFDLLFLDIYMNGMTGMEVARELRELGIKKPIVFLTNSPDFALESYDVDATGYLVKPAKLEKVARVLEKLLISSETPRLAVKCGGTRQYCSYNDLLYLESSNNITLLHLLNGQTLRCSERLSVLEKELSDKRFLRCHQSYLVNMDHIHSADKNFILRNGEQVPIRVRSRREMNDIYYNYFVASCMVKIPETEEPCV